MKRLLPIGLLLLGASVARAVDYTQDANCVGAWLFTEGAGATLHDVSPAGHDGAITGATWSGDKPASYVPYSLSFDGSGDIVTAADPSGITQSVTVVCWAKLNVTEADGHIVSWHPGFFISQYGAISRFVVTANAEYAVKMATNSAISGQWRHFAATYNGSAVTTFLDGVVFNAMPGTGNINTGGDFALGAYRGGGYVFNGYLSEVGIFNRVLSSAEINDIRTNGLKPSAVAIDRQVIEVE